MILFYTERREIPMKKEYIQPEMEITEIDVEDVIVTSKEGVDGYDND